MSLEDFTKNITSSSNMANLIIESFDQLMVLYNFIGTRQDIEVCADKDKVGNISFTLLMESNSDALSLKNQLQGQTFFMYGSAYGIDMHQIKSNLYVHLVKLK